MSELRRVEELNLTHIGKRIRIQNLDGGIIEGTLAVVEHRVLTPFGEYTRTYVSFEEFSSPVRGNDKKNYWTFETVGNRTAREVEEE